MTYSNDYRAALQERIYVLRNRLREDVDKDGSYEPADLFAGLRARTTVLLDLLDEYDQISSRHGIRR